MIIELVNIQAITHAVYDFPDAGVVQITGENNNGKSILIKAIAFVANTLITKNEERESIIKDDCSYGTIYMIRGEQKLLVYVSRERGECYYQYTTSTLNVKRTIREGGLDKLASAFGWSTFSGGLCLQLFETYGVLPFVNNSAACDYEIIDEIITDRVANDFVQNYSSITYPLLRDAVAKYKQNVESCERELKAITVYDVAKYELMAARLRRYQEIVQYMIPYVPAKLPITKYMKYGTLKPVHMVKLPIFRIFPVLEAPVSLSSYISSLHTALSGSCPTCGTKISEMEGV